MKLKSLMHRNLFTHSLIKLKSSQRSRHMFKSYQQLTLIQDNNPNEDSKRLGFRFVVVFLFLLDTATLSCLARASENFRRKWKQFFFRKVEKFMRGAICELRQSKISSTADRISSMFRSTIASSAVFHPLRNSQSCPESNKILRLFYVFLPLPGLPFCIRYAAFVLIP